MRAVSCARLLDDPELEAPSPTFTLMQVYQGPEFPVVHADFYRLRGAEELAQLGWDEAVEGAVTLVEWPDRAAEALPPDRLEIELVFDLSKGAGFRRAEVRAFGALAVALRAGARDRGAAAARRLGRGAARLSAGRRVGARLRALDARATAAPRS